MADWLLIVIAGPNGAGKSTFTRGHDFGVPVLDPDAMARKRPQGKSRILSAGREFIELVQGYEARLQSFGIETTLSGKQIPRLMKAVKHSGGRVVLHYICTAGKDQEQSLLLSKLRIQSRVQQGGHGIPNDDVERRFPRSIANFHAVSSFVDEGYLYSNAGLEFTLLAEKLVGTWSIFDDRFAWLTSGLMPKA